MVKCLLETSQCPFLHRIAKNLVEAAGEGKLVWGSDTPYRYQEVEKRKIELAGLTEQEFEAITWHNMARIVGIPEGHQHRRKELCLWISHN